MYCYHWSLSHTICDNLFDTSIYLHCSCFCSIWRLLRLRWRRIGSIQIDILSTAWPETTCRRGCHETESSSSSCGTNTGSWKTGDMGSNFGGGNVFSYVERNSRVESLQSFLLCLKHSQTQTPNSQNFPWKNSAKQAKHSTSPKNPQVNSESNPPSAFDSIPLYSYQMCHVSRIGPSLHTSIMESWHPSTGRPISSITESLTLENTGPLEATNRGS